MRRAGVVLLERTVRSDAPMSPPHLSAVPGLYEAVAGRYGCVCVVLPDDGYLGLKPGEFRWVEMEPWLDEFWDGDAVKRSS